MYKGKASREQPRSSFEIKDDEHLEINFIYDIIFFRLFVSPGKRRHSALLLPAVRAAGGHDSRLRPSPL